MIKRQRICKCCHLEYPEDELEQHQKIIHGIDSFDYNSNEELVTQEPSTSSSRKPLHFCDECDYETIYNHNLKKHKMAIHGIERTWLYCDECDYKTIYNQNLKKHKIAKHGAEGNWFHCDVCDYKTIYNKDLKKHKLAIHKIL